MKKRISALMLLCAAALLVLTAGTPVQAAKKTAKNSYTTTAALGGSFYVGNATDLTINGKAYNKTTKSKVIGKKTYVSKHGFSYAAKSYAKGSYTPNYITTNEYEVYFRKKGTYTLKYKTYGWTASNISFIYGGEDEIITSVYDEDAEEYVEEYDYEDYYYLRTYDSAKDTYNTGTTKYYEYYDENGYEYYATKDKKSIYAESDENYEYAPATLSGNVVMMKPADYLVTTHTVKVIVKESGTIVKSVKLGKAFWKASTTYKDGGSTGSGSNNRFLSGTKGKLTVSMASKYKIKDILIRTYDKDGKEVWKLVKNKKNVTFGKYAYKYNDNYDGYSDSSNGLFKQTTVYIFYQDKYTGGYTDITSLKKNKDGGYTFKIKYKEDKSSKVSTQTSSYPLYYGYYSSYTFYKK